MLIQGIDYGYQNNPVFNVCREGGCLQDGDVWLLRVDESRTRFCFTHFLKRINYMNAGRGYRWPL